MMWLAVMGACWLGAVALSGDENKSSSSTHVNHDVASNTRKYTVQYVRENLDEWYYSNWDVEDIYYQLQDNWTKDDLEWYMRNGLDFSRAIEEMVRQGKIQLKK